MGTPKVLPYLTSLEAGFNSAIDVLPFRQVPSWRRPTRPQNTPDGYHAEILSLKGDSYRLKDRDLGRAKPSPV